MSMEEPPRGGLFSRMQVGMLLMLIAAMGAGLYLLKHTPRADMIVTAGNADDYAFLINVNSAGAPELALLPGLGPARAQAIVDYRRRHGPFASPDDLTRVPGIGARTVADFSKYIECGAP